MSLTSRRETLIATYARPIVLKPGSAPSCARSQECGQGEEPGDLDGVVEHGEPGMAENETEKGVPIADEGAFHKV